MPGHVFPLFESYSTDDRSRRAVAAGQMWGRGEVPIGVAMKAAIAAHAAGRAATAAARAAGHAVATAHAADHCLGAAICGLKAVDAAGGDVDAERVWQLSLLPEEVRGQVASALVERLARRERHQRGRVYGTTDLPASLW